MSDNEIELKPVKPRGKISDKKKRAMKITALSVVFLAATAYSVYKNGVFGTAKNLLTLVIGAFLGYAAFYLAVLLFRMVLRKRRRRRLKKAAPKTGADEAAYSLIEKEGEFSYDKKSSPLENLKTVGVKALSIIKTASQKKPKKAGKFYFVSFTVYDAIDVFDDTIDKLYEKIDGIFCTFKMQNKPLGFLEKSLENALVQDEEPKIEPKKQSGFKKAVKEKGISFAAAIFKNQINAQVNDLLNFVAKEAVFVFGYSGAITTAYAESAADLAAVGGETLLAATDTEAGDNFDERASEKAVDVIDKTADKKRKKHKNKKNKKVKGDEND